MPMCQFAPMYGMGNMGFGQGMGFMPQMQMGGMNGCMPGMGFA